MPIKNKFELFKDYTPTSGTHTVDVHCEHLYVALIERLNNG